MAKKISELATLGSPTTAAEVAVIQSGVTYKVALGALPIGPVLQEDTTVNFTSTDSVAEMQALINAQPKNLGGYTLTFQFGNGTYALGSGAVSILFASFFGGRLIIQGNRSETNANDLHTTQDVILSGASLGDHVIEVLRCNCSNVFVQNLRVDYDASASKNGIAILYCPGYNDVRYNYCLGDSTSGSGAGIEFFRAGTAYAQENYVSQGAYGIQAADSVNLTSVNNDDTGTQPGYGLQAQSATIFKNGTQPAGSTANELVSSGGQIL